MTTTTLNLSVHTNLTCQLDESPVFVTTSGDAFIVEVPDLVTGLKLIQLGSPYGSYRQRAWFLKRFLDAFQQSLVLRVRDCTVFQIGHGVGGWHWSMLGFPKMRLRSSALLRILIGRQR